MYALVVLLTEPRTYCIIPEEYIYGLREIEDQLKTWGVSKFDHLIFWTRSLLDDNTAPEILIDPNFQLEQRRDFPPPTEIESACYIGRIKRFFKTFEEAKFFRDKFRPVPPAIYNANRSNRQPIPSIDPIAQDQNENVDEKFILPIVEMDQADTNAIDHLLNFIEIGGGENNHPIDNDENENGEGDLFENPSELNDSVTRAELSVNDVKDSDDDPLNLDNVSVEDENEKDDSDQDNAYASHEFLAGNDTGANQVQQNPQFQNVNDEVASDQGGHDTDANEMQQNPPVQNINDEFAPDQGGYDTDANEMPQNPTTLNSTHNGEINGSSVQEMSNSPAIGEPSTSNLSNFKDGKIHVTQVFDDNLEMTYVLGEKLAPKVESKYKMKQSDFLSGQTPFQENEDTKDRAYLVKIDDKFEEVKLKGSVANWLCSLNEKKRNDQSLDKYFIKALLIAVFSIKNIKGDDELHADLMAFIKELFVVRAGEEDQERVESFDDLVLAAVRELRS
ncbi:uncharacterized protein LOC116348676 [Contarinia nasturtii]|uniref:uncharacterized protein LOC116348676 n=1 Tax=Contarinia nasturtii TaxID=265458 RepID=UPI0012D3BFB0|nr:uncharacterized protein LOC116348676 [Contarinia nasturtii]